jgi:type VI secretion system protein ImpE
MVINGKYYWVPYERIKVLALEQPEDLRDLVWMPAQVQLANGGEWVALIPSRYPGSEADSDGAVCMGRKTVWNEVHPDLFHGRGQRVLVTDRGEYSFIGTQRIELGSAGKPGE